MREHIKDTRPWEKEKEKEKENEREREREREKAKEKEKEKEKEASSDRDAAMLPEMIWYTGTYQNVSQNVMERTTE